jgi:hypothetical protein
MRCVLPNVIHLPNELTDLGTEPGGPTAADERCADARAPERAARFREDRPTPIP